MTVHQAARDLKPGTWIGRQGKPEAFGRIDWHEIRCPHSGGVIACVIAFVPKWGRPGVNPDDTHSDDWTEITDPYLARRQ